MKWTPVSTPRGSAFIAVLLRGGAIIFVSVDGEVRAIHAAQVATTALLRLHDVRRVIALGIERGGECQDLGGTELHAKATGFTAFHDDFNSTFCHEAPTCWSDWALPSVRN